MNQGNIFTDGREGVEYKISRSSLVGREGYILSGEEGAFCPGPVRGEGRRGNQVTPPPPTPPQARSGLA